MSLPALKTLQKYFPIKVIAPKFQIPVLESKDIRTIPGPDPIGKLTINNMWAYFHDLWKLRHHTGVWGLDFTADPRAGFLLKVAGVKTTISYNHPWGFFFDSKLPIAKKKHHQLERNLAVVEAFIQKKISHTSLDLKAEAHLLPSIQAGSNSRLILSTVTGKREKNWPLPYWDSLILSLTQKNAKIIIIQPPDTDSDLIKMIEKWRDLPGVEIFQGSLPEIEARVLSSKGVITTDSFIGHMAAYFNTPTFWINGSSDPEFVAPYRQVKISQLEPMPCRPCLHRCNQKEKFKCLSGLKPERVLYDLDNWLEWLRQPRSE